MKLPFFMLVLSLTMLPLIYGMDPNEQLLMAIKTTNFKGVLEALRNGANINNQDDMGNTPLHIAAFNDYIIETVYISGFRAMHLKYQFKVAKTLLNAGADLNARNANGNTPLDVAITRESTEIAEMITSYLELLNQIKSNPTNQLLTQALRLGWVYAVKLLLKSGIKPDLHDLALVKQKYTQSLNYPEAFDKDSYVIIGRILLQHLRLTGTLQASKHKLNTVKKFYYQLTNLSRVAHLSTLDHAYGPISKSGLGLPKDIAHTIASFMY